MATYIIEIKPKKTIVDPVARDVKAELLEAGQLPALAVVETSRLFRLSGALTQEQAAQAAETLLVDPVVETATVVEIGAKEKKKTAAGKGHVVDIWPKHGVTDPVGDTVRKGLSDLGIRSEIEAHTATRYVFPKIEDPKFLKTFCKRILANELIHDIDVRKPN